MQTSPKTLLSVEDEDAILQSRQMVLEAVGFHVLSAANGKEALRLFESAGVSAVLLDYFMPEMDGGTVAKEMKRRNPRVPILFVSGSLSLPKEALACGDGFVQKGSGPTVLLQEIARLLE